MCRNNLFFKLQRTYVDGINELLGDGRAVVILLEDLRRGDGRDEGKQDGGRQHGNDLGLVNGCDFSCWERGVWLISLAASLSLDIVASALGDRSSDNKSFCM